MQRLVPLGDEFTSFGDDRLERENRTERFTIRVRTSRLQLNVGVSSVGRIDHHIVEINVQFRESFNELRTRRRRERVIRKVRNHKLP